MFDVLFHEMGRAVLSRSVIRMVWRPLRALARRRRGFLTIAGPLALLGVVATWVILLITGWALVYLPHMPDGFSMAAGVDRGHDLLDSLYVSMVTLGTVGFGDISPNSPGLRLVTPLQALVGLGLLSASISWLLSIYPVLSRRRSLAYELTLLVQTKRETGTGVLDLEPDAAAGILGELVSRLVAVERDLATFPVSFYFAEADDRFALPVVMPALLDLAERGAVEPHTAHTRIRATMLREAVEDFSATAGQIFGADPSAATRDLIAAYRREHLR